MDRFFHIIFCMLLSVMCLQAQQGSYFDEVLEHMAEQMHIEDPERLMEWHDQLLAIKEYPVDLNNGTRFDIDRLFFLSDFQRHSLYNYVRRYGPVLTLYELMNVHGFDRQTVKSLQFFIVLREKKRSLKWSDIGKGRHSMMINSSSLLQEVKGNQRAFPEGGYEGSPFRLSVRYQYSLYGRVNAGFFADKDPGEAFFRGSNPYGFDYYGAYIACHNIGRLNTMVLGRYRLSYGQGLVMGSGLGIYKSSDVFHTGPVSQSIRGYSSLNETNYLQGVASRIRLTSSFYWDVFASYADKDANLNKKGEITSFYETGYHRTANEIKKIKTYTDQLMGSSVNYIGQYYSTGLLYVYHRFSRPLSSSDHMYNTYSLRGTAYGLVSVFSKWNFRMISLYQEIAANKESYAINIGLLAKLSDAIGISCNYRNYSRNYYASYASGFSESDIRNEKGVYLGTKIDFQSGFSLSAYTDIFQYPWLRYTVKSPSHGRDNFIQLHRKQRRWEAYVRISEKAKMETDIRDQMSAWNDYKRQKFRANLLVHPHKNWRFQSRVETVRVLAGEDISQGTLLFQDFRYTCSNLPLQYTFRIAFFRTENYDSRVYAYESDLLYEYAVPAFHGEGSRTFFLVKWKATDKLQAGMKYGYTFYPEQTTIGSGNAQTEGPCRSEIKAQLICKF